MLSRREDLSRILAAAAVVTVFLLLRRLSKADSVTSLEDDERSEERNSLEEREETVERNVESAATIRDREKQSNPACFRLVRAPTSHEFESTGIERDLEMAYEASGMDSTHWDVDDGQDLEVLVHNVSHKDMVVGICRAFRMNGRFSTEGDELSVPALALARPKFSLYRSVSQKIYSFIADKLKHSINEESSDASGSAVESEKDILDLRGKELLALKVLWFPESKRDPSLPSQFNDSMNTRRMPGGFDLCYTAGSRDMPLGTASNYISITDPRGFKFRNDEWSRDVLGGDLDILGSPRPRSSQNSYAIAGVFFPLLAVLLPKWRAFINDREIQSSQGEDSQGNRTRKVIILVSGVGEPRNPEDRIEDNSTEISSKLASLFIQCIYPDVKVIRLHSKTNIYRYTDNIGFVKFELLPLLAEFRDPQAKRWGSSWREKMRLTVSFADGSPARVSAINAALRPYKPSFMHIWQLQTFWHGRRICLDDVEVLSFAEVDTYPAVSTSQIDDDEMKWVCDEMKRFRSDFEQATSDGGLDSQGHPRHDLGTFWMRKSRKVVLSVLLVRKEGVGKPVLYRGTNMEVSMPTGSLCAERNVIGTALAQDLGLKRRDIRIIAVLSVNLKPAKTSTQALSSISTNDGLRWTRDPRPEMFSIGPAAEPTLPRLKPTRSLPDLPILASEQRGSSLPANNGSQTTPSRPPFLNLSWFGEGENAFQLNFPGLSRDDSSDPTRESDSGDTTTNDVQFCKVATTAAGDETSPPMRTRSDSMDQQRTPQRRTTLRSLKRSRDHKKTPTFSSFALFTKNDATSQKEDVVLTEASDLNPLKPCGACMEWLRKIAEVNPQFAVLTFTDKDCKGVYREHVFHDSG